jgi:acetyltransferase-like isoleucine patch superfamily enzyme
MIKRIRAYIKYQIQKKLRPEIIGGFVTQQGITLSNVRISNTTHISFIKNLVLDDNVFIGHFNYIDCSQETVIGEGTQITNYVSILNHSSHHTIRLLGKKYEEHYKDYPENSGKVYIGKYVFVGPHSVIMPNTKIGEGSIVSAYSFVKGDFPAYSILNGNPAIVVGDTRKIDTELLEKYPDLKQYYYLNK